MDQSTESPLNQTPDAGATPPRSPNADKTRTLIVLAIVAVVVGGMIYMSRRGQRVDTAAGIVKIEGKIAAGDAKGKTAPDFTLADLNGKSVKLSDYRGKAVLVNFWATWCGPCKIEMPWLVELKKQYGPQGFEIVGVATDVDAGNKTIDQFAKDMGVNYQIVLGAQDVDDAYGGIEGLPTNFFVDRNGTIVANSQGLIGRGEIEDSIKLALGPPGASSAPAAAQPAGAPR